MSQQVLPDDHPIDPSDERLVAYLDGELPADDRDQLEQELIDDADLRQRLQELQQGWDWLDDLPDATPNEKLVETTMSLVVSDLTRGSSTPNVAKRRRSVPRGGWWLIAALIGAVCGFAIVETRRYFQFRQEMIDLRLAENLDAYRDGQDLALIRELQNNVEWRRTVAALRGSVAGTVSDGETQGEAASKVDQPLGEEADQLVNLSPERTASLASSWDRFRSLRPEDRIELREIAEVVNVQTDADDLLDTMRDYAYWKQSLPAELIVDIERNPDERQSDQPTRQQAIEEAIELTKRNVTERSTRMLSDQAAEIIRYTLGYLLQQRLKDRDSATRQSYDQLIEMMNRDEAGRFWNHDRIEGILIHAMIDHERIPPFVEVKPEPLTDDELSLIEDSLPENNWNDLEALAAADPLMRSSLIRAWALEAARRLYRSDRRSFLQRYQDIPASRRNRLDLAPPDRIEDELMDQDRRRWGRRPPPR